MRWSRCCASWWTSLCTTGALGWHRGRPSAQEARAGQELQPPAAPGPRTTAALAAPRSRPSLPARPQRAPRGRDRRRQSGRPTADRLPGAHTPPPLPTCPQRAPRGHDHRHQDGAGAVHALPPGHDARAAHGARRSHISADWGVGLGVWLAGHDARSCARRGLGGACSTVRGGLQGCGARQLAGPAVCWAAAGWQARPARPLVPTWHRVPHPPSAWLACQSSLQDGAATRTSTARLCPLTGTRTPPSCMPPAPLCASQDLTAYKKFRNKEVSSAARSLIGLFRWAARRQRWGCLCLCRLQRWGCCGAAGRSCGCGRAADRCRGAVGLVRPCRRRHHRCWCVAAALPAGGVPLAVPSCQQPCACLSRAPPLPIRAGSWPRACSRKRTAGAARSWARARCSTAPRRCGRRAGLARDLAWLLPRACAGRRPTWPLALRHPDSPSYPPT